ncbi:homogentisate 1,2-dioxygenase [Adhaeribacter radiodurans]|uniref:Homogentisate 1,2-dioxygenase n=1 Tax=Adhaeribacter radiodurans TaxID=2745197 RepID=A0A7L7LEE6_9BACT|nr:homogentisate 1,2-dioxygenase [Adhaeribacter radiodurans]QMU31127.1 homogentisate 1,2-dioxygenase [Adhaeribacter radiodurans]
MAYYYRLGTIPPKRHTQFRQPDGSLYAEQLVGTLGFHGVSSLLYHIHPPTQISRIGEPVPYAAVEVKNRPLAPGHMRTLTQTITGTDYLSARQTLLVNNDVTISICNPDPSHSMDYYYKNAQADEVVFVHEGSGELLSPMGKLEFQQGDYLVIPRTVIHQFKFQPGPIRLLIIEAFSPVETCRRYRNQFGQLLEHAPYCERDIRPPAELITQTEPGEYRVQIKKEGFLHQYFYNFSPFDVVGWDGFFYPYAFSIYDFEPITGRIHQPPPVHQTFEGHNFVICSFVPRLFDYHPLAIPAPYNHSNVDSDEVLYYVAGNFMSRKGVDIASFTIHPGGIPHGPHPGTVEASIGKKETHELAVMIDTFKPLHLTEAALPYLDENYPLSWK